MMWANSVSNVSHRMSMSKWVFGAHIILLLWFDCSHLKWFAYTELSLSNTRVPFVLASCVDEFICIDSGLHYSLLLLLLLFFASWKINTDQRLSFVERKKTGADCKEDLVEITKKFILTKLRYFRFHFFLSSSCCRFCFTLLKKSHSLIYFLPCQLHVFAVSALQNALYVFVFFFSRSFALCAPHFVHVRHIFLHRSCFSVAFFFGFVRCRCVKRPAMYVLFIVVQRVLCFFLLAFVIILKCTINFLHRWALLYLISMPTV